MLQNLKNYMINRIVAIQGNHPSKLNPKTDTSIFLANEIQKKNYRIFYYEPKNLSIINSKVVAKGFFIKLGDDKIYFGMIVASNQRPLSVFSKNYFSSQKLNEMTDLNGINILKATYTYFSKIRRTDFYINDLSYYFKTS